jgi:TatD-related deoxyribonuclease
MNIIFDNHLHLNRNGKFLDAIREFKKTGGTHFVLCQLPMVDKVISEKSYKSVFKQTIKMAQEIISNINIGVFVTVGPYPVDYLALKEKLGRIKAIDIMKKGMDLASKYCEEEQCIAIGEIGRPHFQIDELTLNDSNEILLYGMQKAKDADVPVVLHTESTNPEQCKEIVIMGKKAGISANKIIKHFSPPLVLKNENYGIMPSILASKKNIFTAAKKGTRFMMETDYLDDLRRPGAVLGTKTVPKRTFELLEKGILSEEDLIKIHKINPEKTYEISLDR